MSNSSTNGDYEGDYEMEYQLTEKEKQWVELLLKSTGTVREKLLAHDTLDDNELYELINRAEALVWHLAKRDTLPDEIQQIIDSLTQTSTNTP